MKYRRALAALITALILTGVSHAQTTTCADGSPCQNVPWRLPSLPSLPSPTPMPTLAVTAVSPTSTPGTPTATGAPGGSGSGLDVGSIGDSLSTVQAVINATPIRIADANGSFSDPANTTGLQGQASTFFGYARGLTDVNFGAITPMFSFLIFGFVFVFSLTTINFFAPVIAVIFGFIRRIISTILDFLPL